MDERDVQYYLHYRPAQFQQAADNERLRRQARQHEARPAKRLPLSALLTIIVQRFAR